MYKIPPFMEVYIVGVGDVIHVIHVYPNAIGRNSVAHEQIMNLHDITCYHHLRTSSHSSSRYRGGKGGGKRCDSERVIL